jgi:twin BRCT domain
VVPEYFGDSFRLGMVCPPNQYLFPKVEVRNCDLKELVSSALPKYQKPEICTPDAGLFAGKVFFVDTTLYSSKEPKPLWLDNIETLGGKVVRRLESAKTLITESRGQLYEKALGLGLEIGTKRWVRDQIKTNVLSSPVGAILHYPYPLAQVKEMNSCVISVTNYVGDPREDIATMATRMGAKFTRNLSKENTHLICGK